MLRRTFLRRLTALTTPMLASLGCRSRDTESHPPAARRPNELRLLTYNLHHGEGGDGRLDLERIAAVIRATHPDLVALQEIDRSVTRTGNVDQPAEYIRLTGLHGWFGAAMPLSGGEYGQLLLSRWPLQEPRVVRLPGTAPEPRIAVTALVQVPKFGTLRWTGLHLDASRTDRDRWDQVGALLEAFGKDPTPTLLAGDFNATPDSRVMRRMLDSAHGWTDTAGAMASPTVPADAPRSRIDYILASREVTWPVVESKVVEEKLASDHRPLAVTYRRR